MQLVFSAHELPAARRYDAWREALCDHYVHVDTSAEATDDYEGFIREARFGEVTVTDCYLSPQTIVRGRSHLAHLDKDCYYVALTQKGCQRVEQHGRQLEYGVGSAMLFSAAEPYRLTNHGDYRAIYLEFPRAAFARRGAELDHVLTASINLSYGLGRIIGDVCGSMVLEADALRDPARDALGGQVLDLLAMAVDGAAAEVPLGEAASQSARLRQVMKYIDAHIGNPLLNPERVARANQMSVRTLHYLFKTTGRSVTDHLWERRLERCHAALGLATASRRSVTEIALASGFNSLSHFSAMFRRRYGVTPSELRNHPPAKTDA